MELKIEHPKIGQVWEKDGHRRQIINVIKRSGRQNDFDVVWVRPDTLKAFVIWLPYWKAWRNKAALVIHNNVRIKDYKNDITRKVGTANEPKNSRRLWPFYDRGRDA